MPKGRLKTKRQIEVSRQIKPKDRPISIDR